MLSFIGLTLVASFSFAGGFSKGSHFNFRTLLGEIEIQCPNRQTVAFCRDQFLDPWPYDIFRGPILPEASRVQLESSVASSQETRSIEVSYYGTTGKSEEINLGISSIFQRPLLRFGSNQIDYKILSRSRKTIKEGRFVVTVSRSTTMYCDQRKVQTVNSEDCELTYSVCQQYFNDLNYCRQ
jgi:hypothetical protein